MNSPKAGIIRWSSPWSVMRRKNCSEAPDSSSAEDAITPPLPENAAAPTLATGLREQQVAEIKSAIQTQQKFLSELLERGNRWELEGATS